MAKYIGTTTNDELSLGTTVAIMVTTLVVTTLISVVITSLYCKYRCELRKKTKVDDDKNTDTEQKDQIYFDSITNPDYETATIKKINTNPVYSNVTTIT